MIRVKGLISSLKASILTNKNAFPHKMEESWDSEFNEQNPKLNYLQKLLENNSIRPYFIEKDIKQLQKEDIYFYMENKELFYRLPRNSKQQLIKNPNASALLKFHLAQELNALKSQQIQKHLLDSFNMSVSILSIGDLIFCLELICDFENPSDSINYYQLEKRVMQEQNPEIFIKLVYHLSELKFQLEMIDTQNIHEKIEMLQNLSLQNILYVKNIAKFYEVNLAPTIQERLRANFMQKRRHFEESQGQSIVQLLEHYPESANFLNIDCLDVDSYISYLQFFASEDDKQTIPKIIDHPIPQKVVKNAETSQFSEIIELRVNLGIQTCQLLTLNFKDYYTSGLNCIIAIIRYLEKQDKLTPQLQSTIEKSLIKKIITHGDKAFEEYKIVQIFKILGYLSVNNLGSINFWRKSLKFVTNAIEESSHYKNLSSDQQKKFVVYLFQIFKNKPFPIQLEDQIINLTLLSLTINKWNIKQVLPLTISLKVNKIADNQLWFGIEQRINQINIRNLQSDSDRKALRKIIYNFNMIGKGSYEFWHEMNRNLSKKEKLQILNHFKVPSTMAHTYLKV